MEVWTAKPLPQLRWGQTAERIGDGDVRVTGVCKVTGKPHVIERVSEAGLDAWIAGTHIQHALPALPADEREFLISGSSPEGWTELFGNGDDEESSIYRVWR